MKKLIVLFGVFAFISGASFAYYYEDETLNPETLKAQGFSDSVIKVTDKVQSFKEGIHSTHQRNFKRDDSKKGKLSKGYQYLKNYFDPIQDDGLFAEHEINFSNTWADGTTHYSTPEKATVKEVENL